MGSSPSKMPEHSVLSAQLAERLQALEFQDPDNTEADMDFVHVEEDKRKSWRYRKGPFLTFANESAAPQYSPRSTTLSISATKRWEKELLEDPKVPVLRV